MFNLKTIYENFYFRFLSKKLLDQFVSNLCDTKGHKIFKSETLKTGKVNRASGI